MPRILNLSRRTGNQAGRLIWRRLRGKRQESSTPLFPDVVVACGCFLRKPGDVIIERRASPARRRVWHVRRSARQARVLFFANKINFTQKALLVGVLQVSTFFSSSECCTADGLVSRGDGNGFPKLAVETIGFILKAWLELGFSPKAYCLALGWMSVQETMHSSVYMLC